MEINHFGISGGKDSTALLLWAVHESDYDPESLDVTFCDTGNEHQLTYDYIHMLSERIHPIQWLQPELDFYELAKKKHRFPSRRARFCTQHLKMIPTQKHILELMMKGHSILAHSGVRANESKDRSQLAEREWDGYLACEVYRPLLRWIIEDVWAIHERYGIPRNPLYAYGAKRVGCYPCINSNKVEIKTIAKHFPERIDMIRDQEGGFGIDGGIFHSFFARTTVPEGFRTKPITTKSGESMMVATIDDVVRWSQTTRGGRSLAMDYDDPVACDSQRGFCE